MIDHFRMMQMGLMNAVTGLAMALLVLKAPDLMTWTDYGMFLATMVVLAHWHYGTTFVLFHIGPTLNLTTGLLDSTIFFALLGVPVAIKNPTIWFLLTGASYAVAWLRYNVTGPREGYGSQVRRYVKRKSWVELAAVAGSSVGAVWSWTRPDLAWLAAWAAAILNIAAVPFLVSVWRLYDITETTPGGSR